MDDLKAMKKLFQNYPPHIVLLVDMARQALAEGRAEIKDGVLVFKEAPPAEDNNKSVRLSI